MACEIANEQLIPWAKCCPKNLDAKLGCVVQSWNKVFSFVPPQKQGTLKNPICIWSQWCIVPKLQTLNKWITIMGNISKQFLLFLHLAFLHEFFAFLGTVYTTCKPPPVLSDAGSSV